jgi:histidinol phosphatase-like enzyme
MALGEAGAYLDAIYHCPHHPEGGFPGEVTALKRPCSCRKPETGMIEAAVRDLPVDLERSRLFGDTWRDVEAARRMRIRAYQVGAGEPSLEATIAVDLEAAVADWLDDTSSAAATSS